jgi:hypothetical protein
MLVDWMVFLFIPISLSVWGIVRTINLSKFKTKLTMIVILIVIGLNSLYVVQMYLHYPRPPEYWGCGAFLEFCMGNTNFLVVPWDGMGEALSAKWCQQRRP